MTGAPVLSYAGSRAAFHAGEALARITRDGWLPAAVAGEEPVRLAALLTALPAGAVVSGRTAARLRGWWLPPGRGPVDVTVPAGPGGRVALPRRRGVVAHRRRLPAGDRAEVVGVAVTSAARTWLDLAAELPLPDLVAAGDSALRAGVPLRELADRVATAGGSPGVRAARRAVTLLDARSRSRPESHLRVALVTAGLPAPLVNQPVPDEQGGWLAEPDLSYPAARVAIEYQGADHAGIARLRRDTARHMDLRRAGWDVLYYTADSVFGHPDVVVDDVLAALRRRAPGLLVLARGARAGR